MDTTIEASKRDFSKKAKQLRRMGFVPGSVYGGALKEAVSLQLAEPAVRKLLTTKMVGSRVTLMLDGKKIPVQIKDRSIDTLTNTIETIDFQALKADQKVNSVVHILLENTDKVTAVLEHMLTEVPYAALPADMIDTVTIDVDGLPVGTSVTVGDIKELQNDKLELQIDKDEMVFKIIEKNTVVEEEPATVEEKTEE